MNIELYGLLYSMRYCLPFMKEATLMTVIAIAARKSLPRVVAVESTVGHLPKEISRIINATWSNKGSKGTQYSPSKVSSCAVGSRNTHSGGCDHGL